MGSRNEKLPFAATIRLSASPLFSRTSPVPVRPVTVPPTLNALAAQVTVTFVTLADATMPVAFDSVHVCPDVGVGWVAMVTAYGRRPPAASRT